MTAASLAVVMSMTSCGGPGTAESETGSARGDYPITIDHVFGSTTIPEKPERVVALGVTDADVVLALGTVPVGNAGFVFYDDGLGPWADELVGDEPLTHLASDSEPDLEVIAGLEPDVIIGVSAGFDEGTYDALSAIAPTVARPAGTAAYAVGRETATEIIARTMGEEELGAQLNAEADAVIEQVKTDNPEFADSSAVAVLPYDGQFGAFLPGDARGEFLTSLGFEIPDAVLAQDDGTSFFVPVAAENVSVLDSDLILYLGSDENVDVVQENPLFGTLTAGRNDAIIATTIDQRGAISYNTVLSIPYAVDQLVPRIEQAVS